MDFRKKLAWGRQGRYSVLKVMWLLCLAYFIYNLAYVFIAPKTFPIPVQVGKIVNNQVDLPINDTYDLKIERGQFQLYLKDNITTIPKVHFLNVALYLLYLAAFLFMAYQAKQLSYNVHEKQFFHKSNVNYLRTIGQTLAATGLLYPILQRKITKMAISDIHFPNVELSSQIQNEWVYYFAGILFVIAADAFKRGFELQEEQALTV